MVKGEGGERRKGNERVGTRNEGQGEVWEWKMTRGAWGENGKLEKRNGLESLTENGNEDVE